MDDEFDLGEFGQDVYSYQQGGGDLSQFFGDFFIEQSYLNDDSWTDDIDTWWNEYGSYIENISNTWDQESFNLISDIRDSETEGFRNNFSYSNNDLGSTGFASASNIGVQSDLGGNLSFLDAYESGIDPINKKFNRSTDAAFEDYGQSFFDMMQDLMMTGAFDEGPNN